MPGSASFSKVARSLAGALKKLAKACNSFVPDTRVAMADGTTKPIQDVEVGDQVIATDPETGKSEAKPVIALITSKGAKNLVQITIDIDGQRGDKTGIIIATGTHLFW